MAYRINCCGFATQRKCMWIAFTASVCVCILALHHLTNYNKTININANMSKLVMQLQNSFRITDEDPRVPSVPSIAKSGNSTNGFILVIRYSEQQIGAAINMLTLTKWAKTVGASPVEPFAGDSLLFNIPPTDNVDDLLYFHDYFDIDLWNNKSLDINAMPLVSYNTFLTHKPNSIILVQISTKDLPLKLAYIDSEIMNELETTYQEEFSNFESNHKNFTRKNNMTIVRRVCMSFTVHKPIHLDEFTKIIYGDLDPNVVVVLFSVWQGITKTTRTKIIEEEYHRNSEAFSMLQTSQRIIADSKKYVKSYLNSHFGDYVAVSFRSVKRAKYFHVHNLDAHQPDFLKSCMQRLQHTISAMNNTKRIFLAMDLGKLGDNKAKQYLTNDMISTTEHDLFEVLYNNMLTMKKWEEQFVKVTQGISDSGYIAAMQSTLLENSRCLIMFGGDSNFQRNLLTSYEQKHSNPCIREVCYIH